MAARSASVEKLTTAITIRASDHHRRALEEISRIDGVTPSEFLRTIIDREWDRRAEDIQKMRDVIANARKKNRAA